MDYINASSFRQLQKSPFVVVKVYPKYLSGGIKTSDGKFIGRTFVYDDGKLKEKKWDGSKFALTDFTDIKIDRDFFKTYKKVFDVVVATDDTVTIEEKKKGEMLNIKGNKFTVKSLGAYKLQEMLKEDFDITIPMDGDRPEFDWEDELVTKLEGSKYQMKVTGKGLDTSYKFKLLGKGFTEKENETAKEEDLMF